MKKIINTAPAVVIATQRTPLTVSLTTKVIGNGTLTQAQDVAKSLWYPDRTLRPLIIEPVFSIYDPDTDEIIEAEASIKWYVNTIQDTWDSTNEEGIINVLTTTSDYYLETDNGDGTGDLTGRLVILKNVDYQTPVEIICVVEYTDSARSATYSEESRQLLTSENRPDVFYKVNIETASVVNYFPLSDSSSQKSFTAFVQHGADLLPWSNVVGTAIGADELASLTWTYSDSLFSATLASTPLADGGAAIQGYTQDSTLADDKTFYITDGTIYINDTSYTSTDDFASAMFGITVFYELETKTLDVEFDEAMELITTFFWYLDGELIDDSMVCYVSGQGQETLVLDADFIEEARISVQIGIPTFTTSDDTRIVTLPTEPNASAYAEVDMAWKWPSIDMLPIGRGGSDMRETSVDKIFDSVVRAKGVDLSDTLRAEFIRTYWFTHATNADRDTKTYHGWGPNIIIPQSSLRKTGSTNVEVSADIYVLGCSKLVVDEESGSYVIDDDGNVLTSRD